MNIEHYWPDLSDGAFRILRQIGQERQRMHDRGENVTQPVGFHIWPDTPRDELIRVAALIVARVEHEDSLVASVVQPERTKLIRGRITDRVMSDAMQQRKG